MLKKQIIRFLGLAPLALLVTSSAAFAYGGVAAIVFNPQTGAYGSYHGVSSRDAAEANALAECGQSCAGVSVYQLENRETNLRETWARDGWVALARSANGHFGTSGAHGSQFEAEQTALENCGGIQNGCYIVRSLSSFSYREDIDGQRN